VTNELPPLMATQGHNFADPKGLIRESYRIDGITADECRSILLDWALSLPAGVAGPEAVAQMLARYATSEPDHPMTGLLQAGLAPLPERPMRSRDPARRRARPIAANGGPT
jgi:hypothetical protein